MVIKKQPIREMQGYLRVISSENPMIPELKPDGIFGPLTTQAVLAFQRHFDMEATGVVDYQTWDAIYQIYLGIDLERNPPHCRRTFPLREGSYGPGDTGKEVVFIQVVLNGMSERLVEYDTVYVLGKYDAVTERNVRQLQQISGLASTGRVDAATWNVLTAIEQMSNRI